MISWSCILESAISDIEIENLEINGPTDLSVPGYERNVKFGQIYDFAYRIQGEDKEILVSTTRPETMLGDVAVAVHPNDIRYSMYKNKNIKLWHPFRKCEIPLIFDDSVDSEFGTGAVKITPSHDKNDFEIAKRHGLPVNISVINEKGLVKKDFDEFQDLPRFTAREKIIESLANLSMFKSKRDHKMILPICSRSRDVIEYLIRPQWFVDCQEMSKHALEVVKNGNLKISPNSKVKEWNRWLSDCKDWCISRQLWWGHQIPAYEIDYDNTKHWIAARNQEELKQKIKLKFPNLNDLSLVKIKQETDVLDTWFSSALLPFSSLGWPDENNEDFKQFYPLNLMETGHDILFFWVARMIMIGYKMTGKLPFKEILLHGLICDSDGRKMSKSLGNVISPDDVIYGISLDGMKLKAEQSWKNGIFTKKEYERTIKGE